MRIAIVYNEPAPAAPEHRWLSQMVGQDPALTGTDRTPAETGILGQVAEIGRALPDLGIRPLMCGVSNGAALAEFLAREQPDAIFNCCESLRGNAALEMNVAAMFDLFGIAYTGSPALTLALALDKNLAKALFQANGVASPRSVVIETTGELDRASTLTFPLIVKPVAEDASIGIDNGSVVHAREALAQRVTLIRNVFQQAALVEEFIYGRELNVALLASTSGDLEPLPLSEVTFDDLPEGVPPIVSYHAKWTVDSTAYVSTPVRCPAALPEPLAERVRAAALAAARAVGLRDYGRVDLRVRSKDDAVFVLEVNPNPDLSADAGFMRAARASERTYVNTIERILTRAIDRARARLTMTIS